MRVHRARGSFNHGAAVVPWVYAIARNTWLDHVRAGKVRAHLNQVAADEGHAAAAPTGPEANAELTAVAAQTAAVVQRVLASLPPAQREAFVLLRYEGMSVQDAADVVGTSPVALKLRAFRAYEALRSALDKGKASEPRHGT